ncbi:hypothetical protein CY34DRAFT_813833, partial [Suillus luteus UH-Slu-Lm8-n1]
MADRPLDTLSIHKQTCRHLPTPCSVVRMRLRMKRPICVLVRSVATCIFVIDTDPTRASRS